MMIATIIFSDGCPTIRLPQHAYTDLGLAPGQRVRLDIQALPPSPATPRMEPDGSFEAIRLAAGRVPY